MDAMCDFIDDVTEDYMDVFTSGLAQIVTGEIMCIMCLLKILT